LAVIARINPQSALKSASKGIGAFESDRCANIFDTVVANGKAATRLVEPQSLSELSWSIAKFYLEPSTKVPRAKTCLGGESLDRQIVVQMA
jgi:hypothetical protein